MAASRHSVADLRTRPEFAPIVADRVWRAWWQPKGYARSFIEALVQQNLDAGPIPFALVAHADGAFLGTLSVIASDLECRPDYTPCLAALWVEPAHRAKGVGTTLVRTGTAMAHQLAFDRVYLCALPPNHGYYQRLGWHLIEGGVTEAGLAVFASPQPASQPDP